MALLRWFRWAAVVRFSMVDALAPALDRLSAAGARRGPRSTALACALALTNCGDDTPVEGDESTGSSTGSVTDSGGEDDGETTTGSSSGSGASESSGDTTVSETGEGSTSNADTDGSESSGDESGESTGEAFVCDPIDLGSATGAVFVGSTQDAGDDLPEICVQFGGPELELSWTAPSTDSWQFDTLGSSFDTVLQVVRGDCYGDALGCNDDFSGLQSAMLLDLVVGDAVVVLVGGFGGASGDVVLNIGIAAPGDCCEAGFFGGCDDETCEASVCAIDPSCCNDVWDTICSHTLAPLVCAECAEPGSCCFEQPDAGCTDAACTAEVCDLDPSCCDEQWTASCAALAATRCSACKPADCCTAHDTPGCGMSTCEAIVCTQWDSWCCMVEWDVWCAQLANDNCPSCQDPGPCCVANPGVGCEDPAVETCVCDALPQCCNAQWTGACVDAVADLGCGACEPLDTSCVDFDLGSATGQVATGTNVGAGNDTTVSCTAAGGEEHVFSWTTPSSGTWIFDTAGSNYDTALSVRFPDCTGSELACTGYLGDTTSQIKLDLVDGQPVVITLDGFGAASGNYVLNINPPPGIGFCCAANGSPGCGSAPCEATVCAADPSCCSNDWTAACAAIAVTECAACQGLGDCCSAHMSAGCNDLECAATVCQLDPWCCDVEWADWCVDEAQSWCAGGC